MLTGEMFKATRIRATYDIRPLPGPKLCDVGGHRNGFDLRQFQPALVEPGRRTVDRPRACQRVLRLRMVAGKEFDEAAAAAFALDADNRRQCFESSTVQAPAAGRSFVWRSEVMHCKRATDRVGNSAGVNMPLIRCAEQDAIAFERGDLLPGIAEILGQHLAIVFTEKRCVELEFVRKRREPQWESRDLKIAENPIMNGSHCSPFAKMRMNHRFFNAEHWRVWNMRLAHDPQSRFISRQSHQPLADFRIDEIAISYTAAMLGASRIID